MIPSSSYYLIHLAEIFGIYMAIFCHFCTFIRTQRNSEGRTSVSLLSWFEQQCSEAICSCFVMMHMLLHVFASVLCNIYWYRSGDWIGLSILFALAVYLPSTSVSSVFMVVTCIKFFLLHCLLLLSASLYFSKRGAYWDRLCHDVVGRHARALWPNGAS